MSPEEATDAEDEADDGEAAYEEDGEPTAGYDLSYFFLGTGNHGESFTLTVPESELKRQLSAMYPPEDAVRRTCIRKDFMLEGELHDTVVRIWKDLCNPGLSGTLLF